jgi:hypothetical protein
MDENAPRQITLGLRIRGVDILTVQEDNRFGLADSLVFDRTTELNRVLFSRDIDLLVIACQKQTDEQYFCGLIYAHPQLTSIGDCVRDLELIAKVCDPEDCMNQVQYLPL